LPQSFERGAFVTQSLRFIFPVAATLESRGFQSLETNAMNRRKFVLLGCVVPCLFVASTARAQLKVHGNSAPRIGLRRAFTPRSIARMPMHRALMMSSASVLRPFNRVNDGHLDRGDRCR